MVDRLIATPDQALKIWQSMTAPSTRRVATKLRQAGFSVSHMRVARWRRRGWVSQVPQPHPLTMARSSLDDAVPLLTGDPSTTAEGLARDKAEQWKELDQLSDRELLRQAIRELAIVLILASRALRNEISSLLPAHKFLEFTLLIKALAVCCKTACEGLLQATKMPGSSTPESDQAS
jgi:hypothetical protein